MHHAMYISAMAVFAAASHLFSYGMRPWQFLGAWPRVVDACSGGAVEAATGGTQREASMVGFKYC
jgi:hypothetical protein